MSNYLMADIHGDYTGFIEMLKKINFSFQSDKLYILGDAVDRGADGIKILQFAMNSEGRIVVIKGNHERFLEKFAKRTLISFIYESFGGEETIKAYNNLNSNDRYELIKYVESLPLYLEVDDVILTHTGLASGNIIYNENGDIDVKASLDESINSLGEDKFLVCEDMHHEKFKSKFSNKIYCGHVPTYRYNKEDLGKISKNRNFINLDTGHMVMDGMKLACLCLDTGKEYYL